MLLNDFIDIMNKLAPQETALGFDNVGLIIGTDRKQIKRVLVALDCTLAVALEAVEIGADLVLTHHPLLFSAVKRISPECPQTAAVYTLIRNGIALFSAHTNLDAAEGGVNTELCRLFGLQDTISVGEDSIMRVGNLPETMMLDDFAAMVQNKLNTVARISGSNTPVSRIAVIGGSGGAEYEQAHEAGAGACNRRMQTFGCNCRLRSQLKHYCRGALPNRKPCAYSSCCIPSQQYGRR